MPHEENPFVSPQSDSIAGTPGSSTGMWQEGRLLVVSRLAEFPDRCVKCNEPAEGYLLNRTYSWHHPIFYMGLLLGILPYVIVAVMTRKTAKHRIGLCPHHRARRKKSILISWFTMLSSVGMFIFGLNQDNGILAAASCIFFFIGILIGLVGSSLLSPKRIDRDRTCWLKGAGSEFLGELPPFPPS